MNQTHEIVKKVLDELDQIMRRSTGNARSGIFALRARQLIINGYEIKDGQYQPRKFSTSITAEQLAVRIEQANRLLEMGATEAVYGKGRALLHTN